MMVRRSLTLFTVALVVVATSGLVACGDDSSTSAAGTGGGGGSTGGLTIPEGCNPLAADADCLVPYPSDVFLVDDAKTATGKRVAVPEVAQIRFDGLPVDMTRLHPADGFSWQAPILALFPGGIDDAILPRFDDDFAVSTSASSPTVLLDTETGALVSREGPNPHGGRLVFRRSFACTAALAALYCGDGQRDAPEEECDDGNSSNGDDCNNDCTENGVN